MKTRTFIFLTIIALGLLPLFILVSLNLPRTVARFESAATLEAKAVSKAGFTRLNAKIRCINKSLLRSSTLPYARALLREKGEGDMLQQLLLQWFRDDKQVMGLAVHDVLAAPELFLLREDNTADLHLREVPAAISQKLTGKAAGLRSGEVDAVMVAADLLPTSARTAEAGFVLLLSTPILDDSGERLGVMSVLLDLFTFLDDYRDAVWVNTLGHPIYGCIPSGKGLIQTPIETRLGVSCAENSYQESISGREPVPFLRGDHRGEGKTTWMPLVFSPHAEPVMWVGSPVDESSIHSWKRSLLVNVSGVVCLMTLLIFFTAGIISRRLDSIRKELLLGLDAIMGQGREVHFQWRGPQEIVQLAEDLNTLSRRFVEVAEQRNQAERIYRESEEKFRRLAQSASDSIILITSKGRIAYWNRAAEQFFGLTSQQVQGGRVQDFINSVSSSQEIDVESLMSDSHVYHTGKPFECDLETKHQGKVSAEFALSSVSIGGQWHGIWIVRDISERKKNQETAIRQQQQLLHADKMISLGLLVSGVAHEINNPNSISLLNMPMLARAWNNVLPILDDYLQQNGDFLVAGIEYSEMRDQIPQMCKELEESAVRIRRIVKDLKDYARQEASTEFCPVDVNEVVDAAVRLTKAAVAKAAGEFTVELGHDLPLVQGEKQRLIQVVINLIQNSCEALTGKEKALSVATCFVEVDKAVEIIVTDEGEGIQPELIHKIMDPFFTTKRSHGGTGLGLSVSSGIVKQHNGSIRIESDYGKGTRVTVRIPVQ